MWKWLARRQLASNAIGRGPLAVEEIEAAESVLFAVFARYGDSVIAFMLIREFMQRHPGKRYRLVTTPQALPYAEAIIGTSWPMIGIDKRRHFLRLARWLRALRRERPALGLNPWSHGAESEYFIAQARRYCPYRDFAHFSRTENLYRRVRRYLQLPDPPPSRAIGLPAQAQRIVVSPFSTDVRKSLDHASSGCAHLLAAAALPFGDHPCGATAVPADRGGEGSRRRALLFRQDAPPLRAVSGLDEASRTLRRCGCRPAASRRCTWGSRDRPLWPDGA